MKSIIIMNFILQITCIMLMRFYWQKRIKFFYNLFNVFSLLVKNFRVKSEFFMKSIIHFLDY